MSFRKWSAALALGAALIFGAQFSPIAVEAESIAVSPISVAVSAITGLGTNVAAWLVTPSSANLAAALTDETGSGAATFATSPALTTPNIGVATATSVNKVAITAPATSATLTLTDGTTTTGPATSGTLVTKTSTDTLTNKTFDTAGSGNSFSINGVAATANTGTGAVARAAAPTFTTPVLGVATATSVNFGGQSLATYAEGTWTPVLTFGTPGNLSVSYSFNVGSYTKIGRMVVAVCDLQTSSFTFTTASGGLQITGLPFTAQTLTNYHATGAVIFGGVTKAGYGSIGADLGSNSTIINFFASGTGVASSSVTATDTPTAGTMVLRFVLIYEASS